MTKTIGYIRTSKNNQDLGLEVQRRALEKFEPDELFSEQISGRKEHRTELDKALKRLEKGDTLLIYNLARLSRSSRQLVNLMSELNEKEIYLKSIQESIDTRTASGRLFFTVLAGIAEFEAENISIRTKEALAKASAHCSLNVFIICGTSLTIKFSIAFLPTAPLTASVGKT